jgi:hypothetical protein
MKFYALLFCSILISFVVKAQVPSCLPGGANFTYKDTCSNMPTSFFATGTTNPYPVLTYKWDFGDPASGAANVVFGQNPTHLFTAPPAVNVPVSYNVRMTISGSGCADTVDQTINIYLTPLTVSDLPDTLICGSVSLTATGGTSYLWSDGQTGPTATIREGGTYWVRTSQNGCSAADTFKVGVWGQGNHGDYNWNFGSGGLNFSGNPPQVISSGGNSFPSSSASMSTPSGQLLFYSNGQTIFDKNNAPMSNGTVGTAATDNVLIIPDPRSNNNYYVFTTGPAGLTYSVVDMSSNGGLGAVSQTNVQINPSANVGVLAGVSDSAGAFWMTSYDTSTAHFFSIKNNLIGFLTAQEIKPVD